MQQMLQQPETLHLSGCANDSCANIAEGLEAPPIQAASWGQHEMQLLWHLRPGIP